VDCMDGHVAHSVQVRNAYGILVGLNHIERPKQQMR
jgi:hypothetical protein